MLQICTGENRLMAETLLRQVGASLAGSDDELFIVVPRQLTLYAERLLLDGLRLAGSFRLRVLSPARLCALIFAEAGAPAGVRVDERGRVMLMRRAIRAAEGLTIYRNADRRRGFAERCARQLELFIQGGVTPQALRDCAAESRGGTRMKLMDLAAILEQYRLLLRDRFQDGDTELLEAARRASDASFLQEARFWFFGFDITPPTLLRLLVRVSGRCREASLLFPLPNDPAARDYDCCRPLERALGRLLAICREEGVSWKRISLSAEEEKGSLATLRRELYACPVQPWKGEQHAVHLAYARNVREECMLAAAQARRLAMSGMRYGEIQLLCADLETYRQPLAEAFAAFEVPLFQEGSRPVSRLATAECLLTALKLIDKNFRNEDVFTLMRCSYMGLSDDDAGRLANYAIRYGIEGGRWLHPLNRGRAEEIAELEPLRERLMAPVAKLRGALRKAEDLRSQLAALFQFLTDIDAYNRSLALQKEFIDCSMREAAGVLSQSWNRIIGAMDQMVALVGEQRLSLRELDRMLSESLEAAVVKPLPQSEDAVYAQSASRMLSQPARALLVIGLSDGASPAEDGLLTSAQRRAVAQQTKAYLGPDELDAARMKRFYLKEALGMVSEMVWFSCALSGSDGSAQRPGLTMQLLGELFPGLQPLGEEDQARLFSSAPLAALGRAARALSDCRVGETPEPGELEALTALRAVEGRLPRVEERLHSMENLLESREQRDALDPDSARKIYGELQTQSITRLERFARCPFSYFVAYGLHVKAVEPLAFESRDAGVFLHDAVNAFLSSHRKELNDLSPAQAQQYMERIADGMLRDRMAGSAMEDSASVRAESRRLRATACRVARVLAEQMHGSAFEAEELERSFGREDGELRLQAGNTVLEGRIDRMDFWREGKRLRVIDFKLGGKALDLSGAYYGLELQLPVYLGAAMKLWDARSAGVYYFPLDEGVVDTQSTDPDIIEQERSKRFHMDGLLPEDMKLIRAQTPNPLAVFNARMTNTGELYATVPRAGDKDFERLVHHALRMVEQQIGSILDGEVAVSPSNYGKRDACKFCDFRAACLFDARLDANKVRRFKSLKWNEVLARLAFEEGE